MYQPQHFREDDPAVQHALVRAHPLGLLVTLGDRGLEANLIPFVIDPSAGERGMLLGHLARPNPQWRVFDPGVDVLVVFQGPEGYITPSWYAAKAESGKVVPTWNYAVVQVHGRLSVTEDPVWLRSQIESLTRLQEGTRAQPWQVSDAPAEYVEAQIRGIVGLEIEISRIEGKWKVSQNRNERDRQAVVAGLTQLDTPESLTMKKLVEDARR
jgi:transcriptional regulator